MKCENSKTSLILLLCIPWLIAQLYAHHPIFSFFTAFFGSFFIFYGTLLSPFRVLEPGKSLAHQVMRPIVLLQLIFAGYMCCTSIFYFINHLGFEYWTNISYHRFHINEHTILLAKCQRLVLLGHMALVIGILAQLNTTAVHKFKLGIPIDNILFYLSIGSVVVALALNLFPAFIQFKYYMLTLAATAQGYILILGLVHKKAFLIVFGGIAFIILLLNATLSGYKENLLINVITISFLAFPYFKQLVAILFFPCIYILLYFLPTLTIMIRKESWSGNKSPQAARAEAIDLLASGRQEQLIVNNNWAFLTQRFSEIGMFSKYIKHTPEKQPYYGFQILTNSMYALIPRALWKAKPATEQTSMERVYRAGVVNRLSPVSAKTRTVIDGYLSAGLIGVFISMMVYGMVAQWLCNKAEELFGGYELGCMVIFNGIFQPLWRGNNWEFILNNMVYGFLLLLLIFYMFKHFKLLHPHQSC